MIQRDAKYTQEFAFEGDDIQADYASAVVERSCAAVTSLLQEMFGVAERTVFDQVLAEKDPQTRNRLSSQWGEIIRHRPLLESAVLTAVICAYAEMVRGDALWKTNVAAIEKRLRWLEDRRCDRLDLEVLLGVEAVINQAINRDRPLLLQLSAQLASLFGIRDARINCNPLSPVALANGFLAGLMCVDMDIASKRLLFRIFESEFLSRLTVLINGVIARLEEEQPLMQQATGFEEGNPGPIARVLDHPARVTMDALQLRMNSLHKALEGHRKFPLAQTLVELSSEASVDSLVDLLSEMRFEFYEMAPRLARSRVSELETRVLQETHERIVSELNNAFNGKIMPANVLNFFQSLWPGVLFNVLLAEGASSDAWRIVVTLQQRLLDSVTPHDNQSAYSDLAQQVPVLVKDLRRELEQAGYALADVSGFFEQLKLLHLQNLQNKLNADQFVQWQEWKVSTTTLVRAEEIITADEAACYSQIKQMASLLSYEYA